MTVSIRKTLGGGEPCKLPSTTQYALAKNIQRTSSTHCCLHQEPEKLTRQLTFNYFPELSPAIVLHIQIIHIAIKMTMVGLAE